MILHEPLKNGQQDGRNGVLPAPAPQAERGPKGQFAPGNPGGPGRPTGNPFGRKVAALRAVILDVVTPEQLRELCQALLARAKAGDLTAAALLLRYALGPPPRLPGPDDLDSDEWRRRQEGGTLQDVFTAINKTTPAEALVMARRLAEQLAPRPLEDLP